MAKRIGKYKVGRKRSALSLLDGGTGIGGNLTGITNITFTGTLSDGNYTFDTSGNVSGLGTVACGAITSTGQLKAKRTFQDPATTGAAPTAISNGLTLAVNTYYKGIGTACAMVVPAAASSNIGDCITVFWPVRLNNSAVFTFTTADDNFALGSTTRRIGGGVASTSDMSVADDDVLTITGDDDGDGGPGTIVRLVNTTGVANGWAVEAIVTNNGDGSEAGATAFSDAG